MSSLQEIKYIGFYTPPESTEPRVSTLAATNKMDYICDALSRGGYKIHLISPSWIDGSNGQEKFKPQTTIELNENKRLTYCPSKGTSSKLGLYAKIIFSLTWLFLWLVFNTRRYEKILVYHSPWLSLPIRMAKVIKNFRIILEVEEIYGDVSSIHPYFDILETKMFSSAYSFIYSTELLAERISSKKPFIVLYGTYKTNENIAFPPDDGKIHLIYAGIIDKHKAGAFNAIEVARYLPDNYLLHIIGTGDYESLCNEIELINAKSKCKIIYDGKKSGIDFIRYCQSCHIGLSTQKMDGKYLETSFPSKILSYLCMGLKVVSCYVECVYRSQISNLLDYYYVDTPTSIAETILNIDLNPPLKITETMILLDKKFMMEINELFKDV